jgi:hypothetical protein
MHALVSGMKIIIDGGFLRRQTAAGKFPIVVETLDKGAVIPGVAGRNGVVPDRLRSERSTFPARSLLQGD